MTTPEIAAQEKAASDYLFLQTIQDTINQKVVPPIAEKYKVRGDCFTVEIIEDMQRYDISIVSGPIIKLILSWPKPPKEVMKLLNNGIRIIAAKKSQLWTPLALPNIMITKKDRDAWKIQHLVGQSAAQIVDGLLASYRVKITKETIVTYTDTVTGASISRSESHVNRCEGYFNRDWQELSRIIREQYPTQFVSEYETLMNDEDDEEENDAA